MKILSRLIVISLTLIFVVIYNLTDNYHYEEVVNSNLCTETEFPIIMYHSFLNDPKTHGKYVISPEQFEEDIKYIIDKGYEPILVHQLLDYIDGKTQLPNKPIMITIDDGYYNNYLYAYPILKKYNVKAVISPIAKYSELYSDHDEKNAYYTHLTWQQGREMMESNLIEFQNHSYDLHTLDRGRNGIAIKKNEEPIEYQKFLYSDLYKAHHLIKENFGFSPTAIAFPFGYSSPESKKVLDELGYRVSFSSIEGINHITPLSSLQNLKRYNRPMGISTVKFFENILK